MISKCTKPFSISNTIYILQNMFYFYPILSIGREIHQFVKSNSFLVCNPEGICQLNSWLRNTKYLYFGVFVFLYFCILFYLYFVPFVFCCNCILLRLYFGNLYFVLLYFVVFVFWKFCILFYLYFVAFIFCYICILAICILFFCILYFCILSWCILSRLVVFCSVCIMENFYFVTESN